MTPETERIIRLLSKRLVEPLSYSERTELEQWIGDNANRRLLADKLSDIDSLAENYRKRSLINPERARKDMRRRINAGSFKRKAITGTFWIAASAAVFGMFWLFRHNSANNTPQQNTEDILANQTLSIDSLSPGETKAYILDKGKKLAVGNGINAQGIEVERLRKKTAHAAGPLVLEVPRGGEFIVVLEDSTKVWLNSASVLTYPENFNSTDRRVKISGEAYFSVAKDEAKRPFLVECDGQEVKVYGTQFNVRSYPEEENVLTSLEKGSVSIAKKDGAGGELFLSPGKQAVFNKESGQASVKSVNIETVTGWRHGRFVFEDQTLQQIMADLGRWYDFEYEFADPEIKKMVFMGSIPRYADFSTAMLILEKSGDIVFRTSGNRIIVDRNHL